MKTFCLAILAVAALATAADAGTVHYKFTAEVKDDKVNGNTGDDTLKGETISGWLKFDTNDVYDSSSTDDQALYVGKSGVAAGWLSWSVKIDGTDYTPSGTPIAEFISVGDPDSGADSVTASSIYGSNENVFLLNLNNDTSVFSGLAFPAKTYMENDGTGTWKWSTREVTYKIGDHHVVADLKTVQYVPLPAAAWVGLGLLGALGLIRRIRRRR
ncbi:MAG: hypothetical protein ABFS86_10895 [Planctomycetota bacterium]